MDFVSRWTTRDDHHSSIKQRYAAETSAGAEGSEDRLSASGPDIIQATAPGELTETWTRIRRS